MGQHRIDCTKLCDVINLTYRYLMFNLGYYLDKMGWLAWNFQNFFYETVGFTQPAVKSTLFFKWLTCKLHQVNALNLIYFMDGMSILRYIKLFRNFMLLKAANLRFCINLLNWTLFVFETSYSCVRQSSETVLNKLLQGTVMKNPWLRTYQGKRGFKLGNNWNILK